MDARFKKELQHLLNRHSVDSHLNMHDFVIAELLLSVIEAIETANDRETRLRDDTPAC